MLLLAAGAALVVPMAAFSQHAFQWTAPDKLASWGANEYGQAQPGAATKIDAPTAWPEAPRGLTKLSLGARHTLALDIQGHLWAWGDNSSAQAGQAHSRPLSKPTPVGTGLCRWIDVAAGAQHSMGLCKDGAVWAWGANNAGQLGLGPAAPFALQTKPARVPTLDHATSIVGGDIFSAAVREVTAPRQKAAGKKRPSPRKWEVWVWGAGDPAPTRLLTSANRIEIRSDSGALLVNERNKVKKWVLGPDHKWVASAAQGLNEWTLAQRNELRAEPLTSLAHATPKTEPPPVTATRPQSVTPLPAVRTATAPTSSAPVAPRGTEAASTPNGSDTKPPPASLLPPKIEPVVVAPPAPRAESKPAAAVVEALAPHPSHVLLAGRVASAGAGVNDVVVLADGQACGKTDAGGNFRCSVPYGWSGRLTAQKQGFRISPSALRFSPLQSDVAGQNFSAIFDPQ
jgi:hypothetical protein